MIKMIATDIDGTILNPGCNFSEGVKSCIKKLSNNGVKVVLVTGRMHYAALKIAEELELSTPIISYQGGLLKMQDSDQTVLYKKTLPVNRGIEIINWARKNNVHINLYLDDVLYVENDNIAIKRYAGDRALPYKVCNFDDLEIKDINKILAIDPNDADRVSGWVRYFHETMPDLYVVKSTPYFCEISNTEARKSYAVEFLREKWGIKREELLTIGDQDNDIELLKVGGVAVAMGNATEDLKACADYITESVAQDGFVKAIEKFCM